MGLPDRRSTSSARGPIPTPGRDFVAEPRIGYVDRLSKRPDGTWEIQDYKISSRLPTQSEMDSDRQLAHHHGRSQWATGALDRTREDVATCPVNLWSEAHNSDTVNPPGPPDRMSYRCHTA